MTPTLLKVLLVEDDLGDAAWIKELLEDSEESMYRFELQHSTRLAEALQYLSQEKPDAVLLDLGLPDSQGMPTLQRLIDVAPDVPVVVLTGLADEEFGALAIHAGAQDYLIKGQINRDQLVRSLRYAMERQRSEEALRQSEARYRAVGELIPFGIWTAGPDGRCEYLSQSFLKMTGKPLEECRGFGWMDLLPEEDRIPAQKAWQHCLETGSFWDYEHRIRDKDGRYRTVLSRGVPLADHEGRIISWVGINLDISDRKKMEEALHRAHDELELRVKERTAELQNAYESLILETVKHQETSMRLRESEARFAAFMEHLPGLAEMRDIKGCYVFANPAWEKLAGIERLEWLGKTLKDFWPPEEAARFQKIDSEVITTGEPSESLETLEVEEELRHFLAHRFPIPGQDGLPYMVGTIAIDVTDRQRAEEALKRSEKRLRHLADQLLTAQEKERKRLAAELHDELGHALLFLKLSLSSMAKVLLPEQEDLKLQIQEKLVFINKTIERVRRLYHDLSPWGLEDLGLNRALHNLLRDFNSMQSGINWQVDLPNLEGLFAPPVQTIIFRIVQEALTNIGKHANADNVLIAAAREDHQVSFVVQDNGKGFLVAETLAASKPTRGIGLIAIEERLKMIGGSLEIWSQEESGTRITFTVPTVSEARLP
jgi:PAS domain S-box-containing protein